MKQKIWTIYKRIAHLNKKSHNSKKYGSPFHLPLYNHSFPLCDYQQHSHIRILHPSEK